MNLFKTLSIAYYIGMALILLGIVLYLNDLHYGLYFLTVGVIPFLGIRLYNLLKGKDENRRLHSIMVLSALALCAAVIAMYFHRSYWILGALITATLDLYVSLRKFIR